MTNLVIYSGDNRGICDLSGYVYRYLNQYDYLGIKSLKIQLIPYIDCSVVIVGKLLVKKHILVLEWS
jgi:hypothetical protein